MTDEIQKVHGRPYRRLAVLNCHLPFFSFGLLAYMIRDLYDNAGESC